MQAERTGHLIPTIVLLPILWFIVHCGLVRAQSGTQWEQVTTPRQWSFPRDHGAHPEYRTEWWYFTGNLTDTNGLGYGYQLTFFREGLRLAPSDPASSWSIRDLYFAHFTLTDVAKNQFHMAESIARAGPGLAGAKQEKMEVWIHTWSVTMHGQVISLEAKKDDMELTLTLRPRKPLVFHGENGLSRKGPGVGQASYYTSFTDLETTGVMRAGKGTQPKAVTGTSWFDHEFGSNQLSKEQVGWDWFSLHLSDKRDLMIYLLRKQDGSLEPASSGTVVDVDGTSHHLLLPDINVSVLHHWKSPHSSARYPSGWRILIPSQGIDLSLAPLVADQELNPQGSAGLIYWEGAVTGKGTSQSVPVRCEGYAELTGYARSLGGTF